MAENENVSVRAASARDDMVLSDGQPCRFVSELAD